MQKKSPIKRAPLPQAGESSRVFLEERWDNAVTKFVLIPGFLALVAMEEWCHRLFATPVNPWLWTILFLLALPLSFLLWRKSWKELKQRMQGLQGELVVGQNLDQLRTLGCRIFHDIQEDGYNIDHLIIAPNGIFSVETKTPSKPANGQSEVRFDGETVTLTGEASNAGPVIQARAGARRVAEILRQMTGKDFKVMPVLLYVDWFVKSASFRSDVIVMNQLYFVKAFENLKGFGSLSSDTVDFIAASIERYINERK